MPVPHHSVFYGPDALPAAQPTASKHWRLISKDGKVASLSMILFYLVELRLCRETATNSVWKVSWHLEIGVVAVPATAAFHNMRQTQEICYFTIAVDHRTERRLVPTPATHSITHTKQHTSYTQPTTLRETRRESYRKSVTSQSLLITTPRLYTGTATNDKIRVATK